LVDTNAHEEEEGEDLHPDPQEKKEKGVTRHSPICELEEMR